MLTAEVGVWKGRVWVKMGCAGDSREGGFRRSAAVRFGGDDGGLGLAEVWYRQRREEAK